MSLLNIMTEYLHRNNYIDSLYRNLLRTLLKSHYSTRVLKAILIKTLRSNDSLAMPSLTLYSQVVDKVE